jgi:hypothetical protein
VSASRPTLRDRPPPKGIRRVERWLVGLVMAVIAFAIERAVLRSIRKGTTKPLPVAPSTISGTGAEISAD